MKRDPGWKPSKAYNEALGALYGNGTISARVEKKAAPAKPNCPPEEHEQIVAATWMDKNSIVYYHIPNGGSRNWIEAVNLKRGGVKAGVPDFCIPMARKGHHGLYIELKRTIGGRLSESQCRWRDILINEGYDWYEAKGAADLISYVKKYMEI